MATDYYELLGVTPQATDEEIKRAYRRLAREHHPDANPGNAEAEARFKEISVAYETLRDPERRRRYDMFGPEGASGRPGPGGADFGFNDLFEAFFGGGDPFGRPRRPEGPARGPDAEAVVELELAEVVRGATRTLELRLPVTCAECGGSGAEAGTRPERCPDCGGSGSVREVRRSILGQVMTAVPCPRCRGEGVIVSSPCAECRGEGRVEADRAIEVEVPAGIGDGQRLRLAGRGPAARRGGPPGDLYVGVRVRPHPDFTRDGNDLVHVRRLAMTQAALGAEITVETLDGPQSVTVAPGTQPGAVTRLRGLGVPALRGGRRGDLVVVLEVEIPTKLSDEEAETLRRLAELRGEDTGTGEPEGLFSRIRSAFQ